MAVAENAWKPFPKQENRAFAKSQNKSAWRNYPPKAAKYVAVQAATLETTPNLLPTDQLVPRRGLFAAGTKR